MESIQKQDLVSVARYHYGTNFLRTHLRAALGPKVKIGRGADGALEMLNIRFTRDELLTFIFDSMFSTKHHTFIFESDTSLTPSDVVRRLTGAVLNLPNTKSAMLSGELTVIGFLKVSVRAQKYDEENAQFTGNAKSLNALVPFQARVKPPNHLTLKISKFVPQNMFDETGASLTVTRVDFDENDFSMTIAGHVGRLLSIGYIRTNLCTAIKNLVRSQRIGTAHAVAEDADGRGIDSRTKHRTKDECALVEQGWYTEPGFFGSQRIHKTKWYRLESSNRTPNNLNGLVALTIDPQLGKASQDTYSSDDREDFIDELIEQNA